MATAVLGRVAETWVRGWSLGFQWPGTPRLPGQAVWGQRRGLMLPAGGDAQAVFRPVVRFIFHFYFMVNIYFY